MRSGSIVLWVVGELVQVVGLIELVLSLVLVVVVVLGIGVVVVVVVVVVLVVVVGGCFPNRVKSQSLYINKKKQKKNILMALNIKTLYIIFFSLLLQEKNICYLYTFLKI